MLLLLASFSLVSAQNSSTAPSTTVLQQQCVRLYNSAFCPAFNGAYINPTNLSNAFPFFSGVTDVASFDSAAETYLVNPYQWQATKFVRELGCTNAQNATIQYQRTTLCSQWVNEVWSSNCYALAPDLGLKMICQATCTQFATSEVGIVNSTVFCPGPDRTGGTREGNLTKDYVDCTNWTSLTTANLSTCIQGFQNEANCGFGSSTSQLCAYCDPSQSQIDSCCVRTNTDVTPCNYTQNLATVSAFTFSSYTIGQPHIGPTSLAPVSGAPIYFTSGGGLSHGAIAGIVLGTVLGFFLIVGLVAWACIARRRRNAERSWVGDEKAEIRQANADYVPVAPTAAAALGAVATNDRTSQVSSSDSNSHVLDRYRDVNSKKEEYIYPNSIAYVVYAYEAMMDDELTLETDQPIHVNKLYDDDWAHGRVLATGKEGCFPIMCVRATAPTQSLSVGDSSMVSGSSSRRSVTSRSSSKKSN